MNNINPNNTAIRRRVNNTSTEQSQGLKSSDQSFGGHVVNKHRSPGYHVDQDNESRQLIEYNCSSDPEGQSSHCICRRRREHDDDIQMMKEDNIHSDEDSYDDEPTSCFAQCFWSCLNIPWKSIGIGALIAAASASIGFAANSRSTPTGTVLSFAGTSDSIPYGFLLCNGSVLSINEHSDCFLLSERHTISVMKMDYNSDYRIIIKDFYKEMALLVLLKNLGYQI